MNRKIVYLLTLTAFLLSACGISEADIQLTVAAAQTSAVEGVHAQYTQNALLTPSATNTPTPTNTPEVTPTPAVTATPTSGIAAVASGDCDLMGFEADVTVSDGEEIAPNTPFTKTWRLSNQGTCTWDTTYSVAFVSGDQMGGPDTQPLTTSVAPGTTVEISVDMVAPDTDGTYSGFWTLVNSSGQQFGSFYVEIEVVTP